MIRITAVIILSLLILYGCGDSNSSNNQSSAELEKKQKIAEKLGLTLFELDNGIGPIKEKMKMNNKIDDQMVLAGEKIFVTKCTQCHKMDERYTGPALRDVTQKRSPEYIMNMILNPEEMTKKHPEARKMLAMYANQMTFQNVPKEEARQILEYLRMESNNPN